MRSPVEVAAALRDAVATGVRGKPEVIDLSLTALLSGGHLLVEDLPGTGKTLLARSMAAAIGGRFGRVQCTPDLLPTDITGTSVYRPGDASWEFRPGPVFANVVLVDEINRASPRTQAALLEPMEEHQVSVDGTTWQLPEPFFCVATQNPYGQVGTFPLPESQLDRFSIVLSVGLPDRAAEREILTGVGGVDALDQITPVTSPEEVAATVAAVRALYCAEAVTEYVLDLVAASRSDRRLGSGASPRAAVALVHLARARAVVAGRDYVTPDDVQAVFRHGLAHRVSAGERVESNVAWQALTEILSNVPVPRPAQ
ncbi:MAG: AAA family ATPase [Microthrixaceae bacterium]|jgi:MoxR-like ATPase